MNRKIAAIFAADIAGYSKLVAEDEEETLRRLASYRAVMDDFIARAGGRIFNTAGDAVLAEFPSAVEAVRCAIDIQESLRTRNMAYPASRQMSFRIGITIGDVVERNGDLLGDGVNIAARLEGIAPVGGICISRTVYEQVANKLSVQFADIGEQQVKNIPDAGPCLQVRDAAGRRSLRGRAGQEAGKDRVMDRAGRHRGAGCGDRHRRRRLSDGRAAQRAAAEPAKRVTGGASGRDAVECAGTPSTLGAADVRRRSRSRGKPRRWCRKRSPSSPTDSATTFATNTCRRPITRRWRSVPGPIGFTSAQADDETAKTGALDICQKRADALPQQRKCELYAVGNTVVFTGARPPMPPPPWVKHDPATTRPLVAGDIPLIRPAGQGGDREELSQRTRAEGAGARSVRRLRISSQIRRAPTRRCAAPWRFAATTPACRASPSRSTRISSCRSRRR